MGEYVDVRINAPTVLREQLKKPHKGTVFLSSLTDPYQPLEKKYEITRKILQELLHGMKTNPELKVSILSRSYFVTRDIDLFKQFGDTIEVGFSINTLDESYRRNFEPVAAPAKRRLEELKELHDNGIRTYVGLGPVLPYFTKPEELYKEFDKAGVSWVFTESFNTRGANWPEFKRILDSKYPELVPEYEKIYFTKNEWHDKMRREIESLAEKYGIETHIYFASMGSDKKW